MPDAKWTHQEAIAYRRARKLQYGLGGHTEESGGPGETTAQRYETRAAKAKVKIANAQYMNKWGVLEAREQFIERKVQKDIDRAQEVNTELVKLGKYVEAMCAGSTFIPGPIKTFESAIRKTLDDNKGLYTNNKDLARCTIATEQTSGVGSIVGVVLNICQPIYGMQLIKQKESKPEPTDDNPLGYSGWNFVVVFKGSKIPAEIQVNTYAMMYCKMSKEDFTNALLGKNPSLYEDRERDLQFPGGLQHVIYEIARDKTKITEAELNAATQFGIWYTNLARLPIPERRKEAQKCYFGYQAFCESLTSAFAKGVVAKHPLSDPKWKKPVKPVNPWSRETRQRH